MSTKEMSQIDGLLWVSQPRKNRQFPTGLDSCLLRSYSVVKIAEPSGLTMGGVDDVIKPIIFTTGRDDNWPPPRLSTLLDSENPLSLSNILTGRCRDS
jgi:hypothetical protein